MPLFLLIVAVILIVVAYEDTMGDLVSALEADFPPFIVWAAAIVGVGALGYIPGMSKPARALLALVLTVIVLKNYSQVFNSFKALAQGCGAAATGGAASTQAVGPAQAYISNPSAAQPTQAEITGTTAASSAYAMGLPVSGAALAAAATGNINAAAQGGIPTGIYNPATYLSAVESGFGTGGLF